MNILTVKLEQHTPLIHFQSDQYGATLRSSEVKPLLDKFLLKNISKENYKKGIEEGWIREKNGNRWFDYKMSIISDTTNGADDIQTYEMNIPIANKNKYSKKYKRKIPTLTNYPLFFANMDVDYNEDHESLKKQRFIDFYKMSLISKSMPLMDIMTKEILNSFFLTHNFGTRKSKGFGSFYIDREDKLYIKPKNRYFFTIEDDGDYDFKKLFEHIELFYRTLRGGINLKNKNGNTVFYFKSLAYMYAKDVLKAHWDKRAVKENLLDCHDKDFQSKKNCDVRDLLGYSTLEQWLSYNNTIIEKVVAKQVNGQFVFPSESDKLDVERMESPIMFKPFITNEGFKVMIIFQDDKVGLEQFKDQKEIYIYTKTRKFSIDLPQEFTTESYFKYIFEELKLDVSEHVEEEFHNTKEFRTLDCIYNQIKEHLV